jgi:fatty acid desaturase
MDTQATPAVAGTPGATFEDVLRIVRDAGLMDRRPGYYAVKISLVGLAFVAGWAAFALIGDSWWQLLTAVFLAAAFGQCALVGHDAGHRQIFSTRRGTNVLGHLHGNVLTGVSFGWWVGHHTKHHNYPNNLDLDPDITRRQVIFAAGDRARKTSRASGFIIRHQSWLFFVLILLEGLRMHAAGYVAARKGVLRSGKLFELVTLTAHLGLYFAAVFWVLSPLPAVAFVVVHQGLFGLYMGLLFAPNHKGMPVRRGESEELDWLTRQVVTSRNLRSSRLTDVVYGGLNYQIEHHLFPSMPRVNLRRAQPLVREFCLRNGLPYAQAGVAESYRQVSEHLDRVSAQVTAAERAGVPC